MARSVSKKSASPLSESGRTPPLAPMISVAGIRGTVAGSLRLDEFADYAQAFLADLSPRVLVVGGDTRASGPMLRHLVFAAAISSGVRVHDIGIVPTPTVGLMVRKLRAGGGIALTASHNPPQWNALKFFSDEGVFISPERYAALMDRFRTKSFHRADVTSLGEVCVVSDPLGPHLKTLLAKLPVAKIRARGFKVVLDACNGAGLELAERLFKELGVRHSVIFGRQDGRFERTPEPLPENLTRLKRAVRAEGADLGFALDPDADRLAIVDEHGRTIGEERTLVLASMYILGRAKTPLATNLSTTRAMDDVAAMFGVPLERSAIGEAHVLAAMRRIGAGIGGEGNGGVIYPAVHPGRDSATGMGLVLALLATQKTRVTLSEMNARVPDYAMVKDKIALSDRSVAKKAMAAIRGGAKTLHGEKPEFDTLDGLKISFPDRWLHVRPSGTEPVFRLFAEAPTETAAKELIARAKKLI